MSRKGSPASVQAQSKTAKKNGKAVDSVLVSDETALPPPPPPPSPYSRLDEIYNERDVERQRNMIANIFQRVDTPFISFRALKLDTLHANLLAASRIKLSPSATRLFIAVCERAIQETVRASSRQELADMIRCIITQTTATPLDDRLPLTQVVGDTEAPFDEDALFTPPQSAAVAAWLIEHYYRKFALHKALFAPDYRPFPARERAIKIVAKTPIPNAFRLSDAAPADDETKSVTPTDTMPADVAVSSVALPAALLDEFASAERRIERLITTK